MRFKVQTTCRIAFSFPDNSDILNAKSQIFYHFNQRTMETQPNFGSNPIISCSVDSVEAVGTAMEYNQALEKEISKYKPVVNLVAAHTIFREQQNASTQRCRQRKIDEIKHFKGLIIKLKAKRNRERDDVILVRKKLFDCYNEDLQVQRDLVKILKENNSLKDKLLVKSKRPDNLEYSVRDLILPLNGLILKLPTNEGCKFERNTFLCEFMYQTTKQW